MQQWTMEATGHRTGRVSSLQGPQARPRRLPTKQAEGITGACSHLGLSLQEQRPVGRGTTSTRIYTRVCVCLHIYMNRYTHTHRFMGVCIHTGTHICECVHTCLLLQLPKGNPHWRHFLSEPHLQTLTWACCREEKRSQLTREDTLPSWACHAAATQARRLSSGALWISCSRASMADALLSKKLSVQRSSGAACVQGEPAHTKPGRLGSSEEPMPIKSGNWPLS